MIIGILGQLGCGKTCWAVYLCRKQYGHMPIYTNLHSMSDQTPPEWDLKHAYKYRSESGENWAQYLSVDDFINLDVENGLVLRDEVYTEFESRGSGMNAKSIERTHAVMQSRKSGVDIIFTTPFRGAVDRRLRNLCDIIYIMTDRYPKDRKYTAQWFKMTKLDVDAMTCVYRDKVWSNPYIVYPFYNTLERVRSNM